MPEVYVWDYLEFPCLIAEDRNAIRKYNAFYGNDVSGDYYMIMPDVCYINKGKQNPLDSVTMILYYRLHYRCMFMLRIGNCFSH